MKVQIKLEGVKELRANMKKFKTTMIEELEQGTRGAAEATAAIVRSNAKGSLAEAVETKSLPRKEKYPAVTMVGLNQSKAPHQHLVEFGTGPRQHKSGKSVGSMPASGFFRQSIDAAGSIVKSFISAAAARAVRRGPG